MWHKRERSKIKREVCSQNSKWTYDFFSPIRWVPLKLPRTSESRGNTQTSALCKRQCIPPNQKKLKTKTAHVTFNFKYITGNGTAK